MIYLALALMLIGTICLVCEIFIPGFGVFGICGIISSISAIIITILYVPFSVFIVAAEIIFMLGAVYAAIKRFRSNKCSDGIILKETLNEEKKEFMYLDNLLGQEGRCKTPLKPFGSIDLEGVVMEAFSEGEYINAGEMIKVVKICENKIYVRKVNAN